MNQKQQRIVVKIGTSTLTDGTTQICKPRIVSIAKQFAALMDAGSKPVFVSSGAIAAGREALGNPELSKSIPEKQMLAAVGQPRLMNVYQQIFGMYGLPVAQVLLTNEDIHDRKRYLNARNTIESLLMQQVLPIINENDTVATEEIQIGDNDNLSAVVANLIEADMLILLTDQDGLYTADPRKSSKAVLIREISSNEIPAAVWEGAGLSNGELGTGGMLTKLQAAEIARRSGAAVVIANGSEPDVISRIASGERIGTRFQATVDAMESRKRFMLAGAVKGAWINIDQGAAKALKNGGSLLPVGITDVHGQFERGEIIRVKEKNGREIAAGMAGYTAEEIRHIIGKRSDEIESTLGYAFGDEVIHHNNMTVFGSVS